MSQFMLVPTPYGALVPLEVGAAFSVYGTWQNIDGPPLAFKGWQTAITDEWPDGTASGGGLQGIIIYQVVIARTNGADSFAPVPMPGLGSQFYSVDAPPQQAYSPADPGKALVATFIPNPFSRTGFTFDHWDTMNWDVFPDGHNVSIGLTGSQIIQLVFARTDPTGIIIGIPTPNGTGVIPQLPPSQTGGDGGSGSGGQGGGENDEVGQCCTNIVNALAALTTAVEAIAAIHATQGGGGGSQADQCCTNVVNAINSVQAAIQQVKAADLSPIVNVVGLVETSLHNIRLELAKLAGGNIDLAQVVNALDRLDASLKDAGASIAKELDCICQAARGDGTVPRDFEQKFKGVLDYLSSIGGFDGTPAQILTS